MDLNIIDRQNSCDAEFYSAVVNSLLEMFSYMLADPLTSKSCLRTNVCILTCILYSMVLISGQPGNNGYGGGCV